MTLDACAHCHHLLVCEDGPRGCDIIDYVDISQEEKKEASFFFYHDGAITYGENSPIICKYFVLNRELLRIITLSGCLLGKDIYNV